MPIVQVDAPALSTSQYQILAARASPSSTSTSPATRDLSTQLNYTQLQNAWFCLGASPCECPKDTEGEVPPTQPLGNVSAFPLGLSGDSGTGTNGVLQSFPLSHFCHPKKQHGEQPAEAPTATPISRPSTARVTASSPRASSRSRSRPSMTSRSSRARCPTAWCSARGGETASR